MSRIILNGISKSFGSTAAVDGISLSIEKGEFFFLIGPSGCGKTTLLRILAGFCKPDAGSITIEGKDITSIPPEKRNITMVFQNYALWPHMTVMQNICFGLEQRGMSKAVRIEKAKSILETVRMPEKASAYPGQLSGGQQQRVALARALVVEPAAVLLDEPLSNLDSKLRNEMRREISRIQKDTGVTMVYVTHDQKEALSMGHRIALLNRGRIEQAGSPAQLYRTPSTRFAAEFMGSSNAIDAECLTADARTLTASTAAGVIQARNTIGDVRPGEKLTLIMRPEHAELRDNESLTGIPAEVKGTEFQGELSEITLNAGNIHIRALIHGAAEVPAANTAVKIVFHPDNVIAFRRNQ